jgi:hypothetical protein
MAERRYNEAEVAAIFRRATESPQKEQQQLSSGGSEGMTLAQLQDIGREVGVAPELIADAAHRLERGGLATSRKWFGLPIGVGRTIELERRLTDEEWERFVVDLRETFDARGVVRQEGSLRQWTNGNLQALLEPTATGQRVRLRTIKGDSRSMIAAGLVTFGFAAVGAIAQLVQGELGDVSAMTVVAIAGASMAALGAFRLPGWARIRRQQMEAIAERLALVAKSPTEPDAASGA